jgi:zinc/manganese transport system substrate-binding protein
MLRYIIAFFTLVSTAVAAHAQDSAPPVRVVATFSILADMVREVGGDRVQVTSLAPADGDAHTWQPNPADGRTVAAAQLVVRNGLGFEGRGFDRLFRSAGYRGPIVDATRGVTTRPAAARDRHGHGHNHGDADPHAWQRVGNAQIYVSNIAEGLAGVDAANAATYRANAERYMQRLGELDRWVRAQIEAVPQAKRRVITNHDAFGYFGAEYGVTFIAAQGVSTEAAVSAAGVTRVIGQARRQNIRAIFLENMSNPRLIEQIARELGAPVGGRLYSDALSGPGGPAASYEALIRQNVTALVAGMQRN